MIPAKIIEEISNTAGKPIHELFDYVIGTSAGGIIALSLTMQNADGTPKYSASDVVNIFKEDVQTIFPTKWYDQIPFVGSKIGQLLQLFDAKYSRSGIDGVLKEKLGDATFANVTMPITAISYSLDSDGPRLWSKYRADHEPVTHDYFLRDAAGATSAAPTYFPPKVTKAPNGEIFYDIDGGIFANSPTMVGVSEFLDNLGTRSTDDELTVLSIGTGRFKNEPIFRAPHDTSYVPDFLAPYVQMWQDSTFKGLSVAASVGCIAAPVYYLSKLFTPAWPELPHPSPISTALKTCFKSMFAGASFDIVTGDGGAKWIAQNSLIDRMMKGVEISDAFQSKAIDVLRINPYFDKEYKSMDNSSKEHIVRFEKEIDMFINNHHKMFEAVIKCLESSGSTEEIKRNCDAAKDFTKPFGEDFFADLTGAPDVIDFN